MGQFENNNFKELLMIAGGLLIFIFGWNTLLRMNAMQKSAGVTTITNPIQDVTTTVNNPNEGTVQVPSNYSVPADQPFKIVMPNINAEGYIQRVGNDQENRIAVPSNIHIAGWYTGSAKPGAAGLSIIDGHVSGVYSHGIFYDIRTLSIGNEFSVIYGDGHSETFTVKKVLTVKLEDSAEPLFTHDVAIANQLNLVTCGGSFDAASKTYDSRVIVISEKM